MTETTINGVVIETSQPITIRNGVVECGTDPDTNWQAMAMQGMMTAQDYLSLTNRQRQCANLGNSVLGMQIGWGIGNARR